ncbi:MAG: hypothetical protein ACD_34C00399G0007 [uncultured bacterium]|nr:MAG: hypothetical protein ACD_34C00399G0007 [uncultured bacterium]
MSAEIIYDSPFATLWYHPESKTIHHQTHPQHGTWQTEEFRKMMLLGSQTLADKGAQKWLSDDRDSNGTNKDEYQWGVEFWFPRTVKAGWKHWAIVQPKHIIAQLNMEKVVKDYKAQGINTMFFSDAEEAMNWLESQ